MKYLILAFLALTAPTWAGSALSTVTVSQTMTFTSPTGYISLTGAGAYITATTGYFRTISASNLTGSPSGTLARRVATACFNFSGTQSSPITVSQSFGLTGSSVVKSSSGNYQIALPAGSCSIAQSVVVAGNAATAGGDPQSLRVLPGTTTSFTFVTKQSGSGVADAAQVDACVFCQ